MRAGRQARGLVEWEGQPRAGGSYHAVVEFAGSLISRDETFAVPVADAAAMFISLAESASFQ